MQPQADYPDKSDMFAIRNIIKPATLTYLPQPAWHFPTKDFESWSKNWENADKILNKQPIANYPEKEMPTGPQDLFIWIRYNSQQPRIIFDLAPYGIDHWAMFELKMRYTQPLW